MSIDQRSHLERRLLDERQRITSALDRITSRFAETDQEADGDLSKIRIRPAPCHSSGVGRGTA